jgi:hypothetical protein
MTVDGGTVDGGPADGGPAAADARPLVVDDGADAPDRLREASGSCDVDDAGGGCTNQ